MSELVRVRIGNTEANLSRAYAEANELNILEDESTHHSDGRVRRTSGKGGRPLKQRTTVDKAAASKTTAAKKAPASKAVEPADTPKESQ